MIDAELINSASIIMNYLIVTLKYSDESDTFVNVRFSGAMGLSVVTFHVVAEMC